MQKIIQINISGQVIPIEEDAYAQLHTYVTSLQRQFAKEEGKDEIIQDIENRIAELFVTRLNAGAHAIDREDVQTVIKTLGMAHQLSDDDQYVGGEYLPIPYVKKQEQKYNSYNQNGNYSNTKRRLFRNPNDKMLGGVCSGIANYFDIDTVIVRLIFAVLFLTAGLGLAAYILAWIIVPVARTPQDMHYMSGGTPMDFYTAKENMTKELEDLKKKAEEMSRELKGFFSKKK